jgi:DNA polymerase-3 subunit gamma/tau
MSETTPGELLTDEPAFAGFDPAPPAAPPSPYRVLARKYRPQTFDDLIGQEPMVRTVSNAFETGRIPQAWMLTGVRGVGKTTTARILARALNYELEGEGKAGGPRVAMPWLGVQCQAIMESRHVDVLEMDAASHTGVEDVRQIVDGIRYAPVQARYKVYIIDEVHMLSPQAFAAFLKTLEEPPPHAKFVFATTEIRKVPVTILSRCQRFDLRRVEADVLVAHLARICAAEGVAAEPEALAAITRAAEGSVRDALSLLDQAAAHGAGRVEAAAVRDMLGLADRGRVIDLFEAVMRGDVPAAFQALREQYDAGADPAAILSDLASFTHLVTRLKLVPGAASDAALSEAERKRGATFAGGLSMRTLSRAWQMLLKGIAEVQAAPRPVAAAEMVLVRLAYAADLPAPEDALRMLKEGVPMPAATPLAPSPPPGGAVARSAGGAMLAAPAHAAPAMAAAAPAEAVRLARFEDVVALAGEKREVGLKSALERDVHLVRFEEGHVEFALAEGAARSLPNELSRKLQEWTGRRWVVALSGDAGAPTLHARRQAAEEQRRSSAADHPLVQAVLTSFPGAEIVDVRERGAPADEPPLDPAMPPPASEDDFEDE